MSGLDKKSSRKKSRTPASVRSMKRRACSRNPTSFDSRKSPNDWISSRIYTMDERDDTPDYKLICSRCHTNCEVCCEGSRRTGRRKFSLTLMLAAALVICYPNGSWPAAPDSDGATTRPESREKFQTIHNDFYWVDQNGARIL